MTPLCVRCALKLVLCAKCMSSRHEMNSSKKVAHMSCLHFVDLFNIPHLNSAPRCMFDVRNTKLNANFTILIYWLCLSAMGLRKGTSRGKFLSRHRK
jgi:hypothetical protein